MECPRCDSEIDRGVSYCPECGLDIDALKERFTDQESSGAEESADSTEAAADESPRTGQTDADGPDASPSQDGGGESRPRDEAEQTTPQAQAEQTTPQAGEGRGSRSGEPEPANRSGRSSTRDAGPAGGQSAGRQTGTGFSLPLFQGAFVGAIAYVVNYALVFGLFEYELSDVVGQTTGVIEKHQMVGWLFYGAHTVKLKTPFQSSGFNYLETIYADAATASMSVPKAAYYVVPGLGLLWGGRTLARSAARGRQLTDKQRAAAGATVAIGYAALTAAAAVTVFKVAPEGTQSAAIKPELGSAVMLMGVAYPVVLGAVGGFLSR